MLTRKQRRGRQIRPSLLAWLNGDADALAKDNPFLQVGLVGIEDELRAAHAAGDTVRVEAILRCARDADKFFV